MLRLRTLGGLSIERAAVEQALSPSPAPNDSPAPPLNGAAVQRRPLALLAFLSTAGPSGRTRDELLLHLWPGSTPARARNVLKQTVYALRRDLGEPDLVLVRGDRLALNPTVLTSDVAELEAALDRGDSAAALTIDCGAFLDGFSLADVPEFERWAQSERARIALRLEGARRVEGPPTDAAVDIEARSALSARPGWWHSRRGIMSVIAIVGVAAVVLSTRRMPATATMSTTVDSKAMAVLPFDVANADTALRFLARGMVDLLAVRLTNDRDGSIRAIAPRTAISAWDSGREKESSLGTTVRLAQRLGAGRVVQGDVVGTPAHLVLTANMLEVPTGKSLARASVIGTADSLSALVDRLAASLLLGADAGDAGAEPTVRVALANVPLAAIREYVEGQTAYRTGHYEDAVHHFDRALVRDSTFALAALGLAQSAGWAGASWSTIERGARLAWHYQDRLPQHVRLVLLSSVGGADALRSGYVPNAQVTSAIERAADANRDDPEAWYRLGDHYLHHGTAAGLTAPLERASAAFRRAIALDATFTPPVIHLVQLAAHTGDTATVRRLATQIFRYDSTSEAAQFIRWRSAVALGDSALLHKLRSQFDQMPLGTLRLILTTADWDAVALIDADSSLATMSRHAATADEHAIARVYAHAYALDRGRWRDALRATESLDDPDPVPRWHLRIRVLDGLYGGGDTAAARAAADTLRSFADAALASDLRARSAQYDDMSVVAQWSLWHGDRRRLRRTLDRLTTNVSPPDSLRRVVVNRISAALLRAIAANTNGAHDIAAVDSLDRLVADNVLAPFEWPGLYPALVTARLFAVNDRPDRALAAVRRRTTYFPETTYLGASLELEARLALEVGDTTSAAAAGRALDALRAH